MARKQGSAAEYRIPGYWQDRLDSATLEAQSPDPRLLLDLEGADRARALAELPGEPIAVRQLERMLTGEPVEVSKPSLRKWPAAKAIPWLADPWISDSHQVVAVMATPDDEIGPVWCARDGSEDVEVKHR